MADMPAGDPFRLACSECDFKADDGNAFVDHILMTGHTVEPEMHKTLKRDPHALLAFTQMLDSVRGHAEQGTLPPGTRKLKFEDEPPESQAKIVACEVREMPDAALFEVLEIMATQVPNAHVARAALLEAVRRLKERPAMKHSTDQLVEKVEDMRQDHAALLDAFIRHVNAHAEQDIEKGNPREGAHHRAMRAVRDTWFQDFETP
jgi:hypothetical protein